MNNELAEGRRLIAAWRHCVSALLTALAMGLTASVAALGQPSSKANPVLQWNQIFIDTLIATNTANSSSQRLGAIVHTSIFDAYNGIERRYTPLFVRDSAPSGASRRAAVIAAGYTALVGLFPTQKPALDAKYASSLAALHGRCQDRLPELRSHCTNRINRGIDWGTNVANAALSWRASDGFSASYPAFNGGIAVGQWRPTPPAFGPMSGQGLAFTSMFVLVSNTQFRPGPPRSLTSQTYLTRFQLSQSARSRNRIDSYCGPDRAGSILGRECQRALEPGSKPDCAGQSSVPFCE